MTRVRDAEIAPVPWNSAHLARDARAFARVGRQILDGIESPNALWLVETHF
jgi:hypothetical protein